MIKLFKKYGKPSHLPIFIIVISIVMSMGLIPDDTLIKIKNDKVTPLFVISGNVEYNEIDMNIDDIYDGIDDIINSSNTWKLLQYGNQIKINHTFFDLYFINENLWENIIGKNNSKIEFITNRFPKNITGIQKIESDNTRVTEIQFNESSFQVVPNLPKIVFSTFGEGLVLNSNPIIILPIERIFPFYTQQYEFKIVYYYHFDRNYINVLESIDQLLFEIKINKVNIYDFYLPNIQNLIVYSPIENSVYTYRQENYDRLFSILFIFLPVLLIIEISAIFLTNEFIKAKKSRFELLFLRGYSKKMLKKHMYVFFVLLPSLSSLLTVYLFYIFGMDIIFLKQISPIVVSFMLMQIIGCSYIIERNNRINKLAKNKKIKPPKINYNKILILLLLLFPIFFIVNWLNYESNGNVIRYYKKIFELFELFLFTILILIFISISKYFNNTKNYKNSMFLNNFMAFNNLKIRYWIKIILIAIIFINVFVLTSNQMFVQKMEYDSKDMFIDYEISFDRFTIDIDSIKDKIKGLESLLEYGLKYYLPYQYQYINLETANFQITMPLLELNYSKYSEIYNDLNPQYVKLLEDGFFIKEPEYSLIKNSNVRIDDNAVNGSLIRQIDDTFKLSFTNDNFVYTSTEFLQLTKFNHTDLETNLSILLYWQQDKNIDFELLQKLLSDIFEVSELSMNLDAKDTFIHPFKNFKDIDPFYIFEVILIGITIGIIASKLIISNSSFIKELKIFYIKFGKNKMIRFQFIYINLILMLELILASILGILTGIIDGLINSKETYFIGNDFILSINLIPVLTKVSIQIAIPIAIHLFSSYFSYKNIIHDT